MAKILVVEDEVDLVDLVTFILERDKHSIVSVYDGELAFQSVIREKPDLILMDIMLPKVDGYSIVNRLASDPACADIPVIVLTAKTGLEDVLSACKNVVKYIIKPFDARLLRKTVQKALSQKG